MKRRVLRSSRRKKLGLAPGSVVYIGLKGDRDLKIDLIRYDAQHLEELACDTTDACLKEMKPGFVNWMNLNGLNNIAEIESVGRHFEMKTLDVEDLVNTAQRPALNMSDDYLVLIMKILAYDKKLTLSDEHICFVLFKDTLLTFNESDREEFNSVMTRVRSGSGRLRSRGSDYLMYALMDSIVDHYFQVMEIFTDKVEALEDGIFESKSQEDVADEIHALKKEILRIRKAVNPLNEITSRLEKTDSDLVTEPTQEFMKDLREHVAQIVESIEMNREMVWGLLDMYMSLLSNRMNEVMKTLTIISTIFIPLSFIAGVYGMNFEYMPELGFKYGYFILLGLMGVIIILLLIYFKKRKWI